MIDAAIFDMDGIIFDTERLACDVWRSAAIEAGFEIDDRLFLSCVGLNNHDTEAYLLAELGAGFPYATIHETARTRIRTEMESKGPPEKPGIRKILSFLRDAGIPIALATSTSERSARWMLSRSGFDAYFSAFAFGCEVESGKPAPDIFLLALKRLSYGKDSGNGSGYNPARIVVFEDSPAGIKAASEAGMKPVFVPDLVEPDSAILSRVWKRIDRIDAAAYNDFYKDIR